MTETPVFTLVTGASSGIGRAIAAGLSPERDLILHGRDEGRLEETRALCRRSERHLVWRHDLNDTAGLEEALARLLREKNAVIEAFVHSAGTLRLLPFRSLTRAQMDEMMNVNYWAAALTVQALVKKSVNQKRLRTVVFVSSTVSKFGAKAFSAYSASKGALDSLMRCLAVELAPDVRVNSILPGGLNTPMTEGMLSDAALAGRLEEDYPLGLGTAASVADLACFLVSDASRWITGQQIVIDGGRTVNITA